jgi:hypothetical protein
MNEGVLGQDFEQWIALSDAYAQKISRLAFQEATSLNRELWRLSYDLQTMDSSFQPLVATSDATAPAIPPEQSAVGQQLLGATAGP